MITSFTRYMRLLGIRAEPPSLDALTRITRAQMLAVPFENVSKLYRMRAEGLKGIPPLESFLDGIERRHFGGTCYANASHLHGLLRFLGYDADLCGADMREPDVHLVNLVRVEGREYLVDVGYGAPFLEPLPRDAAVEQRVSSGEGVYVLSPADVSGRSRLSYFQDGIQRHGYSVNPAPRTIGDFSPAVAASFLPSATFMNALLIVQFIDEGSRVLRNKTLTVTTGAAVQKRTLAATDDVIEAIETEFSIPSSIARVALEGISLTHDTWS